MERIPILKMGPYLLVTIQVDMHDRVAMTLQDELTQQIVSHHARGVLLDISSVNVVDSFIGRMIGNIAGISRVLDDDGFGVQHTGNSGDVRDHAADQRDNYSQ